MLKIKCPCCNQIIEVETDIATILNLARALGIKELPIVVLTGTPSELAEVLK